MAKTEDGRQPSEDEEEVSALLDRMGALLAGVANALKGEPAALAMHDWSDLPEVAAKVAAENAELKKALAGHLFDGESLSEREALRSELIEQGLRAQEIVGQVRTLRKEWRHLPVWGPTPEGWMILDGVDLYGLLEELDIALGDKEPHVRVPRVPRRPREVQKIGIDWSDDEEKIDWSEVYDEDNL